MLWIVQRRFAHPAEEEYARLLDEYGIPWEYEPHTFLLETDEDGRVLEAVTPDFYLPTIGAYVECTTMKPSLASRKRRKFRKLRETNPGQSVVLMSGFGYDVSHSIVRAKQEGLQGVLYKPFRIDQLLAALDSPDPASSNPPSSPAVAQL